MPGRPSHRAGDPPAYLPVGALSRTPVDPVTDLVDLGGQALVREPEPAQQALKDGVPLLVHPAPGVGVVWLRR